MSLDPYKLDLVDAADFLRHVLPLFNQCQNLLDQILVLNRLLGGIEPAISSPFDEPLRYTLDRIVAVSVDGDRAITWGNLESTLYGGEFGTLVGLTSTRQRLGQIAANCISDG